MFGDTDKFDQDWRRASRVVVADFRGLQTFRQFKLKIYVNVHPHFRRLDTLAAPFHDDFTLRSISERENWRPRDNEARCAENNQPHPVPSRNCTCGYYGSYSSGIIYEPDRLSDPRYCFAAVRQYGDDCVLAQNGLRSSGAAVDGVLFYPTSRDMPEVQRLMLRLAKEDIFYTFSAKAFLRRFPDQSYSDILGFDPVNRLGERREKAYEVRPFPGPAGHWMTRPYSRNFCRPIRPEMIQQTELSAESTSVKFVFEVSLKPEYRPGGSHYKHPLLDVWGN